MQIVTRTLAQRVAAALLSGLALIAVGQLAAGTSAAEHSGIAAVSGPITVPGDPGDDDDTTNGDQPWT